MYKIFRFLLYKICYYLLYIVPLRCEILYCVFFSSSISFFPSTLSSSFTGIRDSRSGEFRVVTWTNQKEKSMLYSRGFIKLFIKFCFSKTFCYLLYIVPLRLWDSVLCFLSFYLFLLFYPLFFLHWHSGFSKLRISGRHIGHAILKKGFVVDPSR